MAAQDRKMAGSAQGQDSSPARVAFELMNHIGTRSGSTRNKRKAGTIGSSFTFSATG
jgi:hypothetical protein